MSTATQQKAAYRLHRAGLFVAYFRGNVPVAEPQVNGRQPPGLHALGDTYDSALAALLASAQAAESKLRNELGNAKIRVLNIKRLLKPVETR